MLTTLAYVNDIVKGKDKSWLDHALQEKFDKLVGALYIALARNEDLNDTLTQLKEDIYNFRIAVIEHWVNKKEDVPTILGTAINEQIDGIFLNLEETDLEKKFRLAFTTYAKILQSSDIQSYLKNLKSEEGNLPTYKELMHMLRTMYGQSFFTANYPHWLDASVSLEMGIILFYLYSSNYSFSREMQKELGQFLLDNIQKFGGYSILLNIWLPDDNDTDNVIEGIRLYHSKLQADLGLTDTYVSVDDLYQELLDEED